MAKSNTVFDTFYSRQRDHVRLHCDSGNRIAVDYEPVYDSKGVWHLEKSGETNRYLEIQTFADSCDINVIMARYRNGEVDVLQQVQGTYGDFSGIPKNYAELMNVKLEAERLFMSFAPEIRESYNNSVEQFMSELGTKEGYDKLFPQPIVKETDDGGVPVES